MSSGKTFLALLIASLISRRGNWLKKVPEAKAMGGVRFVRMMKMTSPDQTKGDPSTEERAERFRTWASLPFRLHRMKEGRQGWRGREEGRIASMKAGKLLRSDEEVLLRERESAEVNHRRPFKCLNDLT